MVERLKERNFAEEEELLSVFSELVSENLLDMLLRRRYDERSSVPADLEISCNGNCVVKVGMRWQSGHRKSFVLMSPWQFRINISKPYFRFLMKLLLRAPFIQFRFLTTHSPPHCIDRFHGQCLICFPLYCPRLTTINSSGWNFEYVFKK
jgi:hypothetical protein